MILLRRSRSFALAAVLLAAGCGERSLDKHLSDAAATGNVREINTLLARGANVNCRDRSTAAWTPLFWSIFEHQDGAALALLAAGADPNLRDGTGKKAMSYAIGPGDRSALIRALITAGANTKECAVAFEHLPRSDPNRIAFEETLRLRSKNPQSVEGQK